MQRISYNYHNIDTRWYLDDICGYYTSWPSWVIMGRHEPSWVMGHPVLGFGVHQVCPTIRPNLQRPAASAQVVGLPRYCQEMATFLPSFKLRSAKLSSQILERPIWRGLGVFLPKKSWSRTKLIAVHRINQSETPVSQRHAMQCNLNISQWPQCIPDVHFVADWTQTGDAKTLIELHLMQHELWTQ